MSDFRKKIEQAPTTADDVGKLQDTKITLEKKSDFLELKIINEMSMKKKMEIKNKLAEIKLLRKKKRYEETNSDDPSTLCNVEFDRNEKLSLEEILEEYKKFYLSKEPEDPKESEKRKQIKAMVEENLKNYEDLLNRSDAYKSIQNEGLDADIAGSSSALGESEIGNDEDLKALNNWVQ